MTKRNSRPTYRVRFDRVGRYGPGVVPDLVTEAKDADELAAKVWRYVRRRLASREVEIDLDLTMGDGQIVVGGFRPAGTFTVRREQAPPPEEVPGARAA